MTVIGVVGDAATTTSVALAVGWPGDDDVLVIEADPNGGSLAGWLDTPVTPSLGTIVANAGRGDDHRSVVATLDGMTHRSNAGVRFVSNEVRARAAHRAVDEAARSVFPALAAGPGFAIADVGSHREGQVPAAALQVSDVVLIVHRQAIASAAAATVRIERLVEIVEELAHLGATVVLGVVGSSPFDPAEIGDFVNQSVPDVVRMTVALADDPLAASTIAGRVGVSAKRLRRLPLMRDAALLAGELRTLAAERRNAGVTLGDRDGFA